MFLTAAGAALLMACACAKAEPAPTAPRKVVFLLDATGSMMSRFFDAKVEIARAVQELQPTQSVNVIVFSDQGTRTITGGYVLASEAGRKRVIASLEPVTPRGNDDGTKAFKLALQNQPDLIWFISDGDFPDNQGLMNTILKFNPGKRTRINTVLHYSEPRFDGLLRNIPLDNRGGFVPRPKGYKYREGDSLRRFSADDLKGPSIFQDDAAQKVP